MLDTHLEYCIIWTMDFYTLLCNQLICILLLSFGALSICFGVERVESNK